MIAEGMGTKNAGRNWKRLRNLMVGIATVTGIAWLLPLRIGVVNGHSMDPTLHTGQVLLVDQSYYRHAALTVGDVVLFHGPTGVYVKRIFAVGGQTVHLLEQGEGEEAERTPVAPGAERQIAAHLSSKGDVKLQSVEIPAGSFFALGDNTRNSEDSRDFGPVRADRIIGRVLPVGPSLAAPDVEAHDVAPVRFAGRIATAIL